MERYTNPDKPYGYEIWQTTESGAATTATLDEPDARGWQLVLTTGLVQGIPVLAGFGVKLGDTPEEQATVRATWHRIED